MTSAPGDNVGKDFHPIFSNFRNKLERLSMASFFQRSHDTQRNDIQQNDTQHKGLICDTQHNDNQHYNTVNMLNVILPNLVMLNVVNIVAPFPT